MRTGLGVAQCGHLWTAEETVKIGKILRTSIMDDPKVHHVIHTTTTHSRSHLCCTCSMWKIMNHTLPHTTSTTQMTTIVMANQLMLGIKMFVSIYLQSKLVFPTTGMIISTVLVLIVTCLVMYLLRIAYGRNKYSHIRSPRLRSFLDFIPAHASSLKRFKKENPKMVFADFLRKCLDEVGDMTTVLHSYHNSDIWTIDVAKATLILSNNDKFKKPSIANDVFDNFCGTRFLGKHNLVFSPGDEIWQKKRKIMDAAFHRKSLKQTYEGMRITSNRLIEALNEVHKDGEIVDIYDCLIGATLEVITRTGFSIDEDVKASGVADGIDEVFEGVGRAFESDLAFLVPWMEISLKKKIRENIRAVRDYLTKHLLIRIENAEDMKNKDDILAHIIRANLSVDGFGVEEIIDDFFSFFLAGMETTSSSMSFFLLMMIRHSDVCKRVREEVSYFITCVG